jgi:hypothetical protein
MQHLHAGNGNGSSSSYEQEHYAPVGTVVNGDTTPQAGM